MHIAIRQESHEDFAITENVIKSAFASMEISDKKEHLLVSRIRNSDAFIPELSLVAINEDNEQIIGHILLSKIKITNDNRSEDSLVLAPVSVLPEFQNKGIGKLLISNALEEAKKIGYNIVIVLGHPEYYPKFGFKRASFWSIKAPFEVPDDVFMALELQEHALSNLSGVVEYSKAFFE